MTRAMQTLPKVDVTIPMYCLFRKTLGGALPVAIPSFLFVDDDRQGSIEIANQNRPAISSALHPIIARVKSKIEWPHAQCVGPPFLCQILIICCDSLGEFSQHLISLAGHFGLKRNKWN